MNLIKKLFSPLIAATLALSAVVPAYADEEDEAVLDTVVYSSGDVASDDGELVIVLDPGHGGTQIGAADATQTVVEKEINLKVAQYTKEYLERYDGVTVYLTRDFDSDLELSERADIAAELGADVLISQHFNSFTDTTMNGAEVYISVLDEYKDEELAADILANLASLGISTERGIRQVASQNGTMWTDGERLADYYGIIRNSAKNDIPAIIVEHCFLSNADDVEKFASDDVKLKMLGIADARAIAARFGLTEGETEMRGVWVASVYGIDYPSKATTDAWTLRTEIDEIVANCAEWGMNAIFFQVRPSADALYKSEIFPWSRHLTGTVGQAPSDDFDPLEYMITEAHKRGIDVHAWINPYRVTVGKESEYESLPDTHPAKQHPDWLLQYDGNYYFNPAKQEAIDLITSGVEEIVKSYDIDGIHFDDYFYPSSDVDDYDDYAASGTELSIEDWRRDNVNRLIQTVGEHIHTIDADVSFGVAPPGIWGNSSTHSDGSATAGMQSYDDLYADSRLWALEGWVDYIAPQVYWQIGYDIADYSIITSWWADTLKDSDTKLYIGMADYRTASATSGVWAEDGTGEIERQLNINSENSVIDGEIHYSYSSIAENEDLQNLYAFAYSDIGIKFRADTASFDADGTATVPLKISSSLSAACDDMYALMYNEAGRLVSVSKIENAGLTPNSSVTVNAVFKNASEGKYIRLFVKKKGTNEFDYAKTVSPFGNEFI